MTSGVLVPQSYLKKAGLRAQNFILPYVVSYDVNDLCYILEDGACDI